VPITYEEAELVVASVRERATQLGAQVTVALVDEGGTLQRLVRMDGAPPLSARIAEMKAATVALFRRDGAVLRQMQTDNPAFFGQLDRITSQPVLVGAGALLIRPAGTVLGAIAVSGGTPGHDDDCAAAGISSLAPASPVGESAGAS
jgi:glc operon protein GlcG